MLYLLDGTLAVLLELVAGRNRVRRASEMILVAVEDSKRDRVMVPVVAMV